MTRVAVGLLLVFVENLSLATDDDAVDISPPVPAEGGFTDEAVELL